MGESDTLFIPSSLSTTHMYTVMDNEVSQDLFQASMQQSYHQQPTGSQLGTSMKKVLLVFPIFFFGIETHHIELCRANESPHFGFLL